MTVSAGSPQLRSLRRRRSAGGRRPFSTAIRRTCWFMPVTMLPCRNQFHLLDCSCRGTGRQSPHARRRFHQHIHGYPGQTGHRHRFGDLARQRSGPAHSGGWPAHRFHLHGRCGHLPGDVPFDRQILGLVIAVNCCRFGYVPDRGVFQGYDGRGTWCGRNLLPTRRWGLSGCGHLRSTAVYG